MLRPDLRAELSGGASAAAAPALQRAQGRLELAVGRRGGASRLLHHREEGSAKARFPRPTPAGPFEAVLVNTAGGLAGGDRFELSLRVHEGAQLAAIGQAAEKVYRSSGPDAVVDTRLTVDPGGTLLWLPQETILFDGARLARSLEAELAPTSRLLLVEPVVLGRTARGEEVRSGRFVERRAIRIGATLVWLEPFRLEGRIAERADRPALLGGARAFASLLAFGSGIEAQLEAVRARLAALPARAAAGFRPPFLIARLLAADGLALRRTRAAILEVLSPALGGPAELPRIWRC